MHDRIRPALATVRALSVAASLALALALAPAAANAAFPAWTSYDHDGLRSAADPDSGSPVTPTPAWPAAAQLDGAVYAQPLVYGSRVYAATENDTIYALDAATGAVVWQRSVGTPVPAADLPCGDIAPTVGVTSTPAIDSVTGRVYAVLDNFDGTAVQHRLVALDLATGNLVPGFPIAVDPPGADPKTLLQRAALALAGGRVIIPYGGNAGDCGNYHGWLVSAAQTGAGAASTFEVDPGPGNRGGAIWGAGDGPSVDGSGHVFVSTGNGFGSTTSPDLQESVVELGPGLNAIAHWTASNWAALDASDLDLGSSEPLPLPGGLLFQAGKDGIGRLLSEGALGTAGQVFSAPACGSGGVFGASLYRAGVIYVPCSHGLAALMLSLSASPSFSARPGWSAPAAASGPPIFAGGLVWSTGWRSSRILYGLDPATGAIRVQTPLGSFEHFAAPSAGGGRLFVAVGSNLTALTISSFPPTTAISLTPSANPSPVGGRVNLTATVSPTPDGGTVAFVAAGRAIAARGGAIAATDGAIPARGGAIAARGGAIAGCGAVNVNPVTGRASCLTSLALGSHTLLAAYSGDPYFGASTSAPLTELIDPAGPKLSAVRLGSYVVTARRGATIELTLSEPAALHLQVSRAFSGRQVGSRCRVGAKTGRRCVIRRRARRSQLPGRRGRNRLRLNLRRLPTGRYLVTIVARDAGGTSSTSTVRFEIVRPAH